MNRFIIFAATLIAILTTACGNSDTYIIEGEIVGLGTQNIHIAYLNDDAVHSAQATALDGKFRFEGKIDDTVIMDLYSSAGAPLATFIVTPGEHIKCRLNLDNPADDTVEGSDMTARLFGILAAGITNASIDNYVAANTTDPVSSVLVTSYYDASTTDPAHIDSVISLIHPESRLPRVVTPYSTLIRPFVRRLPATATLYTAEADTFVSTPLRGKTRRLLIINTPAERKATVAALKKQADKFNADNLTIIEYTLAKDTTDWKASLRADTISGRAIHAYSPGGLASPLMMQLGVTAHPLYIVADTAGLILARTPDLSAALSALN